VTVPRFSRERPFARSRALEPLMVSAAPLAMRVVPGPAMEPPLQLELFAADPVRSMVAAPPSVPEVWASVTILEGAAVLVTDSVLELRASVPSTRTVATAVVPDECVTVAAAGMQTTSSGAGTVRVPVRRRVPRSRSLRRPT
jgi:hypothetical protein